MTPSNHTSALATLGDISLSLPDLLAHLRRQARLLPLLREATLDLFLKGEAERAGLCATPQELQQAANSFRRRNGLSSVEATHAWLAQQGLSIADFEATLGRDLMLSRLRTHLTNPHLAGRFEAHQERYARVRLRQLVAASEGIARELLSQLTDEGADFAELARAHSQDQATRFQGGDLGVIWRCRLTRGAAEAVFATKPGGVVTVSGGGLVGTRGLHLFLVEELLPPVLDEPTSELIRSELFTAFLRQKAAEVRFPTEAG